MKPTVNNTFFHPVAAFFTAVLSIGLSTHVAIAQEIEAFPDVQEGNEYFVAVRYMKEHGLVEGYPDGTFQPYRQINRAEALKVLLKAFPQEELMVESEGTTETESSQTESNESSPFPDVLTNEWFTPYVLEAWEEGLVEGYPDGNFHPEETINKVESLKIALIREGGFIPEEATAMPYNDVPTTEWYAPYAEVAKNRTIFLESRDDGSLHPNELMNRGNFVRMLYRIIKSAEGSQFARATWYGTAGVNWGTASGEKFDYSAMAAAHKTLPFGTKILVTNTSNGKQVLVTINDRGPYPTGLDLDLTSGAFEQIAALGTGIITTEFEIVENPEVTTETTEETTPDPTLIEEPTWI